MKRLRRILFNTLTAVSLLLALATAGLWCRQVINSDRIVLVFSSGRVFLLGSQSGIVGVISARKSEYLIGPDHSFWRVVDERNRSLAQRVLPEGSGFNYVRGVWADPNGVFIQLPLYAVLLVSAALPLWKVRVYIYSRRNRQGHCQACGYDMRANPAKCSECGHQVQPVP